MSKIFVEVTARHFPDSNTRPLSLKWDGRVFNIDRALDVRQAPSLKGGGLGIRYTCRVRRKEFYLFDEEEKWFVEG